MNNIDKLIGTVRRLEKAVCEAPMEHEANNLKKSLGIARVQLARTRAKIINSQPEKHNIDFHWKGVKRSTLSDTQKADIIREFGRKAYMTLPA